MKITIVINTDTDAFKGRMQPEVSSILRNIASQIREFGTLRTNDKFTAEITDKNAHTCGTITVRST